ncbi:MAG TPA: Gfo/Idh/MocA family oxidoreductase, partial [Streptosporangiaceae bacterium]|nr:Gfo/Idh/MocA family oxidoreductase [Streptosporangiaceae bacterium]
PADGDPRPADGDPRPAAAADPAALDISGHVAQIGELLAAIDEGRAPAVDGEAGRATLEIVCAVYESARSGRAVTLGS